MPLPRGLLSDLKRDEGWSACAYRDSLGYLTIGYGFNIDPRNGEGLSLESGAIELSHRAEERWSELCKRIPWILDKPEDVQRALANMTYQMGVSGVLGFSLMLAAIQRGDREAAALNALKSTWAEQTPDRAHRIADLIRGHPADGDD